MRHPLEVALLESGIACRVEVRDRLAVLVPEKGVALQERATRRLVEDLARRGGFTHIAIEVGLDGAPLPRD